MTGGAALVVDASAVIEAVLNPSGPGRMARSLMASAATHAPHLIDAEVGHVLRRRALARDLQTEVAFDRLGLAHRLVTTRHEMSGALSGLAWRLLDEVTFYDALYVALAGAMRCPLMTADLKLAEVARRHVEVLTLAR